MAQNHLANAPSYSACQKSCWYYGTWRLATMLTEPTIRFCVSWMQFTASDSTYQRIIYSTLPSISRSNKWYHVLRLYYLHLFAISRPITRDTNIFYVILPVSQPISVSLRLPSMKLLAMPSSANVNKTKLYLKLLVNELSNAFTADVSYYRIPNDRVSMLLNAA
jgi:hypothetical protein